MRTNGIQLLLLNHLQKCLYDYIYERIVMIC